MKTVFYNKIVYILVRNGGGTQLVEALRYKPEGRGFNSRWCHLNFSFTYSFRPHYGTGVDSAFNRKSTRNVSWRGGGKGGRCVGLTLQHLLSRNSGTLTLLKTYGPVQGFLYLFFRSDTREWPFLGTYRELCQVAVCLCTPQSLPSNTSYWNFIFWISAKTCQHVQILVKISHK